MCEYTPEVSYALFIDSDWTWNTDTSSPSSFITTVKLSIVSWGSEGTFASTSTC